MFLSLTKRKEPGWLAITLNSQRIDVVRVVRESGRQPRLASFDSYRKEGSDVEALTRLRRSLGLQRYRCTTLIDSSAYQFLQVEAPQVHAAELKAAMRWRIKEQLEFPVEQAVVDVLDIPLDGAPPGRPHLMFAVAARSKAVGEQVQVFQQAGIPLEVIDVAEMAQRNIAALFEQPGRGLAMLAFYEGGGLLTFTRNGELFALRRIDVPAQALTEANDERRIQLFERVGLELQRSLDNFDRQFSHVPLQRLLVCSPPGATGLLDYLKQNLYLPVEEANLGTVLDTAQAVGFSNAGEQSQYLSAIGIALRTEGAAA
jgi:MSHA biogenesis protein MshI